MAESLGLYPLSTLDAKPIPFDVIRPKGLIRQDVSDAAVSSIVIPECGLIAVYATTTCIIKIGSGTAILPANGAYEAGQIIIPPHMLMNIDHNGATLFSALSVQEAGILFVICVDKWQDVRKPDQYARS